jgi:hypothetical protein
LAIVAAGKAGVDDITTRCAIVVVCFIAAVSLLLGAVDVRHQLRHRVNCRLAKWRVPSPGFA